MSRIVAPALLLILAGCATEGVQNAQFDANPVHAPGIEYVGDTYDAVTGGAADVASQVADGLLTPIRFVFDYLEQVTSPYPYSIPTPDPTQGMNAVERQGWRRQQMGLPESAESRVATRRSQLRASLQAQAQSQPN
ncbi:MAG: hypothetical protein H6807_02590 [Planctomycetes bacterium]|nr:hypothetical protein [Planctomycetota bacterium]